MIFYSSAMSYFTPANHIRPFDSFNPASHKISTTKNSANSTSLNLYKINNLQFWAVFQEIEPLFCSSILCCWKGKRTCSYQHLHAIQYIEFTRYHDCDESLLIRHAWMVLNAKYVLTRVMYKINLAQFSFPRLNSL